MKKHTSILTYTRGENYGVVYFQERRVFLVVGEDGKVKNDSEFLNPTEAIDWAFDNYKEEKKDVRK